MNAFLDKITEFLETTGLNILSAIVILVLGLLIIKTVTRISKSSLQRTAVEGATASFIVSIINLALKLVLIFVVVAILFPKASAGLIAALGTAGLAIGLALQGSLSNFANGIIIIFTKPFKEGDYVDIGGTAGTIRSINILTTELLTVDNKKVVLNNTKVVSSDIINYSARPTRRLDLKVYAAYGSDMKKVKEILTNIAQNHEKVLKTPAPLIRMSEHADDGAGFNFRVWVPNKEYWGVYYDMIEQIYFAFEENNIEIPLRRMNLYMKDKTGGKNEKSS
ncbi:MAG: mechanosensitive ion channel [Bacillota bacterium]|jgi:small conductance mechanosensitive channel|nr:mechanosensitive ion channel [Bacillota bacterium]HHU43522.1 mechanosensitive ion channel [Clostridiales bacterium]